TRPRPRRPSSSRRPRRRAPTSSRKPGRRARSTSRGPRRRPLSCSKGPRRRPLSCSRRPRARSAEAPVPDAGDRPWTDALAAGPDGLPRCFWAVGGAPEYVVYHDEEWGRPVLSDHGLFERLTLEAFQSGLSWLTILRKRPAFRTAFAGFDVEAVARFGHA